MRRLRPPPSPARSPPRPRARHGQHQPRTNHGGVPIRGKAAVRSAPPLSPVPASTTAAAATIRGTLRCHVGKSKDKKRPPPRWLHVDPRASLSDRGDGCGADNLGPSPPAAGPPLSPPPLAGRSRARGRRRARRRRRRPTSGAVGGRPATNPWHRAGRHPHAAAADRPGRPRPRPTHPAGGAARHAARAQRRAAAGAPAAAAAAPSAAAAGWGEPRAAGGDGGDGGARGGGRHQDDAAARQLPRNGPLAGGGLRRGSCRRGRRRRPLPTSRPRHVPPPPPLAAPPRPCHAVPCRAAPSVPAGGYGRGGRHGGLSAVRSGRAPVSPRGAGQAVGVGWAPTNGTDTAAKHPHGGGGVPPPVPA